MRALIVEDSATCRVMLRGLLAQTGWEFIEAETLARADLVSGVDLLIVDVFMPDGDGLTWAAGRTEPVVVLTSGRIHGREDEPSDAYAILRERVRALRDVAATHKRAVGFFDKTRLLKNRTLFIGYCNAVFATHRAT